MSRIKLLFYSTESRHRWEPVWQRKRVTWEHEAEISKQSVGSALRIAKYNARWYRVLSPLSEMDKGVFYRVRNAKCVVRNEGRGASNVYSAPCPPLFIWK